MNYCSLAAHSAVVLKAESMVDKVEWINKISKVIQARGGQVRIAESGYTMRQSLSDGSLVSSISFAIIWYKPEITHKIFTKKLEKMAGKRIFVLHKACTGSKFNVSIANTVAYKMKRSERQNIGFYINNLYQMLAIWGASQLPQCLSFMSFFVIFLHFFCLLHFPFGRVYHWFVG